jgi:membrane peptidoglycan carboxypeptidase
MRLLKKLLKLAVVLVCLLIIVIAPVYGYLFVKVGRNPNRPNVEYVLRRPQIMSKIAFADGSTICEVGLERRVTTTLDKISKPMILAILATEDNTFFLHNGVVYLSIGRAFKNNMMRKYGHRKGGKQGASTITQQIVKILLLTSEQTLQRKASEYFLALELEKYMVKEFGSKRAAKEKLLEIYLNWINFDRGRFGVETASWYYFGHSAATLDWNEALALAAIPKNPSRYNPRRHPDKNLERRKILGNAAVGFRFLSRAEYEKAIATPLKIVRDQTSSGDIAQWICDTGKKKLDATYCKGIDLHTDKGRLACNQTLSNLGIVLKTGIRKDAQAAALQFLNHGLNVLAVRHPDLNKIAAKERAKKGKGENVVSGAVIAVDNKTGNIIVDAVSPYDPGSLNLAFAPQQPGSTMKPLVYATAFEMGLTPDTTFVDEQVFLDPHHPEKPWPVNYEPQHLGAITIRYALAESVNTVAVQVIIQIGAANVIARARLLGIVSPLANERSLALGASAISPLEMAGAYATFARGGEYVQPLIFTAIGKDQIVPERRRALSPTAASMTQDVTHAVVMEGTGRGVKNKLPVPAYAKTGTTTGHTDAWFALFTADYTVVVWVGHRERQTLGGKETGASAALPIALDVMRTLYGVPAGAVYAMSKKAVDDSQVIEGGDIEVENIEEGDQNVVEDAPSDLEEPEGGAEQPAKQETVQGGKPSKAVKAQPAGDQQFEELEQQDTSQLIQGSDDLLQQEDDRPVQQAQ